MYECKFDETYYGSTVVTEWNLVCDHSFYASLIVTLYMCGSFSALFIGYMSDRFGRKKVSVAVLLLLCLDLLVCQSLQIERFGFSDRTQLVVYLFAQVIMGMCGNAMFAVNYILLIELTTSKYSTLVSNVNLYMFVAGELVIAFVAYFARNWHIINWY